MADEVDSLTVKLAGKGGEYISLHSLVDVIRETVAILQDLDSRGTLVWKLKSASTNSPLSMTFVAVPAKGVDDWSSGVSGDYVDLLLRLDRGDASSVERQPKAAMRAQKVVNVLNNSVGQMSFKAPGREAVAPTQRVQATVSEFVESRKRNYTDFGTLEGDLRTVTVQGGDKFHVYDRLTGQKCLCSIAHDQLERAKSMLEKRVWVTGRIKYKNDRPASIEVESFDAMPARADLPQFDDIRGIDVTGDIDSVEFVRRQRDAG